MSENLDLVRSIYRGLGTRRRPHVRRVGAPGHRVRDGGRTSTKQANGIGRNGGDHARVRQRV